METSQESATENLAAAATATVESGVRESVSEIQKGNMKVEGSDSADGPVVDVAKNDVEVKQEVQDKDGLEGGKDAEMEIDSANGPVNQTEVVLLEEIKQEEVEVEDMDRLGIENLEKSGVQENVDQGNGVQENMVQENGVQENMIQEDGVQEVGEQEMNVNGEKSDEEDEEDVGEEDHKFAVGDFVWGKVKNYPWWPGQIYDPSDASDYAEKNHIVKGSLLVAYFGDGSFSWCRKSQLKRFTDNFDELSRESISKKFLDAVAEALDWFSRFLDVEISSTCVHLEKHIWDFKAKNRGIKAGVSVPRGDYLKLFLARLEPEQLLGTFRHAAKTGAAARLLELRVLKSWLAAFYHRKRSYDLVEFREPIPIEGLEDKMGNGVNGKADIIDTMEEDIVSEDKLRSNKKMIKGDHGSENVGNGSVKMSSGKRGRKKKAESVKNSDLEKVETDSKEETPGSFASRERKKSKYLSPPYTPPKGIYTSKIGERMTRVAGQLIGSTPILTSCSNQSNKNHSNQIDTAIDVNEVLSVITESAIDPLYSRGKKNLDQIKGFISAFRSSGQSDGSNKLFDMVKSKESDGVTGLGFIIQKLEKLTSEVKSWEGQVTARKKRKLEGELKDLVAEVSVLPESSP